MANKDMITLRILIRMTQKQKAVMMGRGEEYLSSPATFEMSRKHAATIANMSGQYEVTAEGIYAGFGGLDSQLHVPYKINLSGRIADEMVKGDLKAGGNIDNIMDEVAKLIKEE